MTTAGSDFRLTDASSPGQGALGHDSCRGVIFFSSELTVGDLGVETRKKSAVVAEHLDAGHEPAGERVRWPSWGCGWRCT